MFGRKKNGSLKRALPAVPVRYVEGHVAGTRENRIYFKRLFRMYGETYGRFFRGDPENRVSETIFHYDYDVFTVLDVTVTGTDGI